MTKQAAKILRTAEFIQKFAEEQGTTDALSAMTDDEFVELLDDTAQRLEAEGAFADIDAVPGDDVEFEGASEEDDEDLTPEAVVKLASTEEGQARYAAHAAFDQYVNRMTEAFGDFGSDGVGLLQKFAETPPVAPAAEAAKAPPLARLKAWFNSLPPWAKASIVGGAGLGVGLGAGIPIGRATAKKKESLFKFAETPPVAPAAEAAKAPPLARLKAWFNSLPPWAKASIVGGTGLGVGLGAGIPIGRATARKK